MATDFLWILTVALPTRMQVSPMLWYQVTPKATVPWESVRTILGDIVPFEWVLVVFLVCLMEWQYRVVQAMFLRTVLNFGTNNHLVFGLLTAKTIRGWFQNHAFQFSL